jgi:mono/diheme cytochrome c family protein
MQLNNFASASAKCDPPPRLRESHSRAHWRRNPIMTFAAGALAVASSSACDRPDTSGAVSSAGTISAPATSRASNPAHVAAGKRIFRFDTFGDETFWTDTLRMHEVIRTAVSPKTALAVGLKVDADALPPEIKTGIANGTIDLDAPATTVALLKLDAVLGVVGQVDANNTLTRVGITCALCHSTVDNSFAPGIGSRLDGWPNRSLNVGAIVALSPALTAAQKAVYNSWGPGKYDPRFNVDGKNIPVVLPPAFGLRHVKREVYTGDGPVSYWNAYVAITQMHGHGRFVDPRIGVSVNNPPDLVSSKLDALRDYQLSLEAPHALAEAHERISAKRGRVVFNTVARCATCHLGDALTDVNANRLHAAEKVGQDPAYALRTATKLYRTTPLRGLWHPPQLVGPYFHDGSARTLEAVVEHYVRLFDLKLTAGQKGDLVEYLKTL